MRTEYRMSVTIVTIHTPTICSNCGEHEAVTRHGLDICGYCIREEVRLATPKLDPETSELSNLWEGVYENPHQAQTLR